MARRKWTPERFVAAKMANLCWNVAHSVNTETNYKRAAEECFEQFIRCGAMTLDNPITAAVLDSKFFGQREEASMSVIKNKSTPEGREFWAHVERVAKEARERGVPAAPAPAAPLDLRAFIVEKLGLDRDWSHYRYEIRCSDGLHQVGSGIDAERLIRDFVQSELARLTAELAEAKDKLREQGKDYAEDVEHLITERDRYRGIVKAIRSIGQPRYEESDQPGNQYAGWEAKMPSKAQWLGLCANAVKALDPKGT